MDIPHLRSVIAERLTPLIDSDYVLLGAPYHLNIGDILIWEGTRDFLKSIPHRCRRTVSIDYLPGKLSRDTIILLMGGGNFGDLWPRDHQYRLDVVRAYPHNRIVVLPQSVCYQDRTLVGAHAEIICGHQYLTLCARDDESYAFMRARFPGVDIRLVPDMAFCISEATLVRYRRMPHNGMKLYLKRSDSELAPATMPTGYDTVSDWPSLAPGQDLPPTLRRLTKVALAAEQERPWLFPLASRLLETYAARIYRRRMVDMGLRFVASYREVVTTRLHVMIAALLLGRRVSYVDNLTHKLSSLVRTWGLEPFLDNSLPLDQE